MPRSASVHIMAVDTHTTVPNRREQNVGTLSRAPVLSLQSCLQLESSYSTVHMAVSRLLNPRAWAQSYCTHNYNLSPHRPIGDRIFKLR